jgi:hypothetical protein
MSQSTPLRSASYSFPSHLSVKVLGKYTLISIGTPPSSQVSNQVVVVTRPFFHPERLRDMIEQNSELLFAGIVLLVAPILFIYFGFKDHILYDGKIQFVACLLGGGIAIRLAALVWIGRLSIQQKNWLQDQFLLAFFLPALALLITGFTLGEPVRYATWVNVEESVEEEVAAVAEPQPAAVSERIPSQQPYSHSTFPYEEELERRRQAMEEAELARIAS